MLRLCFVVADPAMVLDHAHRREVVRFADDQHSFHTNRPCLVEYSPERPLGNSATTSRRSNPVADVAHSGHKVRELVAQRDSAQQFGAVNNPSVGAIGLADEAADPRSETFSRLDLVGFAESKTVFVLSWPPLVVSRKPCKPETRGGCDQVRHQSRLPFCRALQVPCGALHNGARYLGSERSGRRPTLAHIGCPPTPGSATVNCDGEGFADFGHPRIAQSPDSIDKHTYGNTLDRVEVDSWAPANRVLARFKHHFTREPADCCRARRYQCSTQPRDGSISGKDDDGATTYLWRFAPPKFSTQR